MMKSSWYCIVMLYINENSSPSFAEVMKLYDKKCI